MVKRRETLSGYLDEDSDDSRSAAPPEGGRYSASRVTKVLVSRRAARTRAPGRGFRGHPTHGTVAGAYCQLWRCAKEKGADKKADVDQGGGALLAAPKYVTCAAPGMIPHACFRGRELEYNMHDVQRITHC